MAILSGCEDKYKTPVPEDRICPVCGKEVEVFTSMGRVISDTACTCGYVWKAEELPTLEVERKEEEA